VRSPQAAALRDALAREGVEAAADGERLQTAATPERVGEIAAANGIVLHELRAETATLEEAFLELTSEGGIE
jgi:ABC-2 type transport system ATP-binding protein